MMRVIDRRKRCRLPVWCCAVLFALQQFSVVQAQYLAGDLDIDPPVIDHESLTTGVAGEPQYFSAGVVDDRGIKYVELYYRDSANSEYSKVAMQRSEATDEFAATIETLLGQNKIEYYIEAADTGGNRVLKGFPFFPLLRNLETPKPASVPVTSTATQETSRGSSRLLYILVGALAVGLLASVSSGGDPGDDNGGGQVPLTINISSPVN